MTNLFLPPFPQTGLTTEYIDLINSIFATIASHTHKPELDTDGNIVYPSGNVIESDSVDWNSDLNLDSVQAMKSISFSNAGSITPQDNTLFVMDEFSNLYFKKVGVAPIQITNRSFVNFSSTIAGIGGGNFAAYGVELIFDSPTNTYNFLYSNGLLNIFVRNLNVNTLQTSALSITNFTLTNAPNRTRMTGVLYYNDDNELIYSQKFISLDKTVLADTLIFDNALECGFPPIGFGTNYNGIASFGNQISIIQYQNNSIIRTKLLHTMDAVWCPIVTNDEKIAGNVKALFYSEPASSIFNYANWQKLEVYGLITATERWVINLSPSPTTPNNFMSHTRIAHYTFTLMSDSQFPPSDITTLKLTGWNDCLIENTVTGGLVEKYILIDLVGTPVRQFSMKFHYLYDMGDIAV